jgi:hypothetical protein
MGEWARARIRKRGPAIAFGDDGEICIYLGSITIALPVF